MKNAIIINGETFELVPNDTGKDVCGTCDLYNICIHLDYMNLCGFLHGAYDTEHYVKREGGQQ